ncbi:hypothetical protein GOODEAATRI_018752 [Goodea atripinnis]|uniref:Uncharacterized protein n=1 Tax=Goodea atripinnis TaxID=208336 RepID=A0ABV0MIY6_9TELE
MFPVRALPASWMETVSGLQVSRADFKIFSALLYFTHSQKLDDKVLSISWSQRTTPSGSECISCLVESLARGTCPEQETCSP